VVAESRKPGHVGGLKARGVSTSRERTRPTRNIIWSCGLFDIKGLSVSRVSPPGPLSISYGHVGCSKARAFPPPVLCEPTRSPLNIIRSCGLFEGKDVSTSRERAHQLHSLSNCFCPALRPTPGGAHQHARRRRRCAAPLHAPLLRLRMVQPERRRRRLRRAPRAATQRGLLRTARPSGSEYTPNCVFCV
jgi:hypothetical protein